MKALGMGGAYVAAGDNANVLVYNPALLSRVGFDLVIPSLRLRLDDNFWDVANFIVDHQEDFAHFDSLYAGQGDSASLENLEEFLEEITPYEDRWGKSRFAPMFSLSFKHFGIGIFNTTDIWIKVDKGIYNPKVYGQAVSDLVFVSGYSQPVSDKVTLGVTGKYVSRRTSGLVQIGAANLGGTNEVLKPAYNNLRKDERGIGLDLGVLYAPKPRLDFGFVMTEVLSQIGGRSISRNLKAGVAYRWETLPWLSLRNGVVAADVEDLLFTSGDSFFKQLHVGAATTLFVFDLRAGCNRGYLSAGIGLNLYIFNIDYVYYGEELGTYPGHKAEWYHALELAVGW